MMVHDLTREQLGVIKGLLEQLDDQKLSLQLKVLNNATLGMHFRHIVEFYQCMFAGLKEGKLDYDLRKRDQEMEVSRDRCGLCVNALLEELNKFPEDMPLELSASNSHLEKDVILSISTTYFRELLYNIEHCVHHLAIIKIGMESMKDNTLIIDSNLGVAASTLRNKMSCAQ